MKKFIQSGFLLLFFPFCVFSQRKLVDSILNLLKKSSTIEAKTHQLYNLTFQLANIDPDSAIIFGKQAVALAIQSKIDSNYAASTNSLGWAYYRAGKYDSAETCFQKGVGLYHKLNMKDDEGRVRLNLVTLFESKKNHQKALTYALPVTELFEVAGDKEAKAYTEKEIGIIYRDMGQFDKAKTYLESSMSDYKNINDEHNYWNSKSSLGGLFLQQKLYDSALICYRQSLTYFKNTQDVYTAFAFENMGEAFFTLADSTKKSNYADSALVYYLQAKTIFAKSGGISDVAYEEINIGKCLRLLKKYNEAIKYLSGSLAVFKKNQETEYEFNAASELSNVYNDMGNYTLAYKYLLESNVYKDSIDASNNKEKIAEMFAQFETDKKDRTIILLNTQQKLDQQQISRQHIITIFIISVGLFGIFIGLILWNRRTIKQKLKELEMRNQLSSDLHDDIGSSLSSILLLSSMAAQKKDDSELLNKLLGKINTNAKEVIDRMSDIVWTMNPKYDEGESLRERIENYVARLKEITTVVINSNIDQKIDQYHFSMDLRKNIFLIIKEAMNNALKHANASLLQLNLVAGDKYFELVIKDNGTGFNTTDSLPGNGFETMIHRAKASNGQCIITSAVGQGTEVKAAIPLPHIR